jgi:hypothetical protein
VIVYAPGRDREASVVAGYLPGVPVTEARGLDDAAVAVVVPVGFAPLERPPAEPVECPSP